MAPSQGNINKSFLHKFRKFVSELGLFLILLFLPLITIWIAFYNIQETLLINSQNQCLDEMAEMTAHMLRLTEPQTYYQESLRRLSESFKWVKDLDEVKRIGNKEVLELALFDENGNRLKWPANENLVKTKISQDYLKALKKLSLNPESVLSSNDQKTSLNYSGNSATLSTLAGNRNSLISFQGIGLRKMGGWFKVQLPLVEGSNKKRMGDLIAWLDIEKVDKYALAEKTISTMQRLTAPYYTFSFIDLKNINRNKSSNGRILKKSSAQMLSSNSLKSSFIYNDELITLSDSQEGIRLICSRPSPKPIKLLNNYNRLLLLLIPVLILLFIWKTIFKVNNSFSIKTQAALIFGSSAFVGIIAILISITAYKYEKNDSITNKYKQEAIEILEKVDQQYTDSFDDLLHQYRHFKEELAKTDKSPKEILAPLIKATREEIIAYAVYVDDSGEVLFHVPEFGSEYDSNISKKYRVLANRLAIQGLRTFNSSRSRIKSEQEPASIQVFTSTAVEGLLTGRSQFIETKLDNEETLAFLDFIINEEDYATGCLLILHEPKKLERHYLNESGININTTKDYELIAFPKTSSNQELYYPKYFYVYEEPLWKLNDMVNQTQLPSFKSGKINEKEVIVAAIPANKMKSYNLFLSMPVEKMSDKTISLSNALLVGTICSLIFLIVISILLGRSINAPMNILRKNAKSIKSQRNELQKFINYSDSSELESISTGISNLVIKTKEFYDKPNIVRELLAFNPYKDSLYETNIRNESDTNPNSLYYASSIPDQNILSIFIINNKDEKGLPSSIPLAIAGMALKTFIEQTGLYSPSALIANLDEYFRLNHKISFSSSIICISLNTKTGIINYCGYGNYSLVNYNYSDSKYNIYTLPIDKKSIKGTQDIIDKEIQLESDSDFFIIDETSSENKERLLQTFEENLKNSIQSHENLLSIISENSQTETQNIPFIYIYRKKDNINNLNKKLAEINPIALIRSQKTGSQSDA